MWKSTYHMTCVNCAYIVLRLHGDRDHLYSTHLAYYHLINTEVPLSYWWLRLRSMRPVIVSTEQYIYALCKRNCKCFLQPLSCMKEQKSGCLTHSSGLCELYPSTVLPFGSTNACPSNVDWFHILQNIYYSTIPKAMWLHNNYLGAYHLPVYTCTVYCIHNVATR